MLNMLYNITVLEPFTFFYYDYMTVTVSCDMCDTSCDCDVMLDAIPRSPSIENKEKRKRE